MKDYYKILELPMTSTPDEIKSQYRLLVNAWHPDKFSSPEQKSKAEERLKDINEAYTTLGNLDKRRSYDAARMDEIYQASASQKSAGHTSTTRNYGYQSPKEPEPEARKEPPKQEATSKQEQPKQQTSTDHHNQTSQNKTAEKKVYDKKPLENYRNLGLIIFIVCFFLMVAMCNSQGSPSAPNIIQPSTTKPPAIQVPRSSTPGPTEKIINLPRIASSGETLKAYYAGTQYLQYYAERTVDNSGIEVFTVRDLRRDALWGYGWCFKDLSFLEDNWSKIQFEFRIEDDVIPIDDFYIHTESQTIDVPGGGSQPAQCRFISTGLFDWPIGDYELSVEAKFGQGFSDGWGDVSGGDWSKVIYNVSVKSLPNPTQTRYIAPKPTQEKLWWLKQTQTAIAKQRIVATPTKFIDPYYYYPNYPTQDRTAPGGNLDRNLPWER